MITSLFDLDRTVREATRRLARARASLSERLPPGEPVPSPLAPFRSVLSKATYDELADLPDPLLAPALRSHLARLILARVLWDDEVRLARAWTDPSVTLGDHTPLPPLPRAVSRTADGTSFPPKLLLQALLVDPNPDRRARIAEAFTRAARDHLRDPARRHADRRAAASHQLGVPLDALDLPPITPAPPPEPDPALEAEARALASGAGGLAMVLAPKAPASAASVLDAAAADLLSATAPLRVKFGPWDAGLAASMAHEATAGWPAHLSPRWILSVFAGTELSRAESLSPVRLPIVLGATSFARALAVFGEAFAESAASTAAPFAMMRAPIDLRPMRVAALTASLAADPVVARRVLDLGPSAARDHARLFARAAAANLRLAAAASRARRSFFPLADDLDDRFCEETASAWGEPLPPELAGLVPRIDETTPARFAALLLAANDRAQMIERFDEDWYRNPRSAEALRALATEPLAPIPEAALRRGAAALARQLLDLAT